MIAPSIILGSTNGGLHNLDPEVSAKRIERGRAYQDLSTVCVIPTRGKVDSRVVESWWSLMTPMNQPFVRLIVRGMEVAAAYNSAVETILAHPQLKDWPYLLTLEEDNMPPADGLLRLHEALGERPELDAVGGLYWTKGPEGQPMIYGQPGQVPMFAPQRPEPETLVECNGLGMGFTLFRMDLFRDERIPRPWFKTVQELGPGGGSTYSQDLYFFEQARKAGHQVACDTRVRVGHYDEGSDIVW
jgi:hypothetical protein